MSDEGTGPIGGGGDPGSGGDPSGGGDPGGSPTEITREALIGMIPEDIRGEAIFQNIKEENPIADMASQFHNAQKLVGQDRMPTPQEGWSDEDWGSFWDKAGRPETSDKYVMPEVEGLQWDDTKISEIKDWAHKEGIPDKHFQSMMGRYGNEMKSMMDGQAAAEKEAVDKGLNQLRDELTKDGKDFNATLALANEALKSFNDDSLTQLFNDNPTLANHPGIIKQFAAFAEANRESLAKGSNMSGGINNNLDAKQAVEQFEEKHAEVILADPEKLSLIERDRRDKILKQRDELFQLAYPPEE